MLSRDITASLEQLRAFVSVVDCGSFSAAARSRGLAQPAISQTVRTLEVSIGRRLFDRSTYRPMLTTEGRALLPFARRALGEAAAFDAAALSLAAEDHCITLSIDHACPIQPVLAAFDIMAEEYSGFHPSIVTDALDSIATSVLAGRFELGLASSFATMPDGLNRVVVGENRFTLLASARHPLAVTPRVTHAALSRYDQIVMIGRNGESGSREFGVLGRRVWHTGDVLLLRALLLGAKGYAIVPDHLFADELITGDLVRLTPDPLWPGWHKPNPYFLIWRGEVPLSPIARRFVDLMSE